MEVVFLKPLMALSAKMARQQMRVSVSVLLATTLDHPLFGLYAIAAYPVAADLVMHGIGIAMLAASLRLRWQGSLRHREGKAINPYS